MTPDSDATPTADPMALESLEDEDTVVQFPREPHRPNRVTRSMVQKLAGLNQTHTAIAKCMRLRVSTLQSLYGRELERGGMLYTAKVAEQLHSVAIDREHPGFVKAATFWLERVGGPQWRKVSKLELASEQGTGALPVIDSRKLTPDERDELRRLVAKATGPAEAAEALAEAVL